MRISSPVFDDGEPIPERFGYTRENVNPPLVFSDIPEEASSVCLIMDDPDALEPAGKIWLHWMIWNIPVDVESIEENEAPGVQGVNDYGEKGYGGPNPPDREHTYVFRAYALDRELDLDPDSDRETVEKEIKKHAVDEDELKGLFRPL